MQFEHIVRGAAQHACGTTSTHHLQHINIIEFIQKVSILLPQRVFWFNPPPPLPWPHVGFCDHPSHWNLQIPSSGCVQILKVK